MEKNALCALAIDKILTDAFRAKTISGYAQFEFNIAGNPIVIFTYQGKRYKIVANAMDD